MDVAKDVELGPDPEEGGGEVLASPVLGQDVTLVQSSIGSFVGDEDIGVRRDEFPMLANGGSPFQRGKPSPLQPS